MKVIDVYSRYYEAECEYSGRPRHAARVMLTATSEEGNIKYEAQVTFFPHDDPEDFSVSYDAAAAKTLYEAKGRRSKKREAELMKTFEAEIDGISAGLPGRVFWDRPIGEARLG